MERNFEQYHRSISAELKAAQDRVRNLIGSTHWQSDGEHKEAILRKVLGLYLPETLRIGRGFVSCSSGNTAQIDILISDTSKPTLFKDNDFVIVTSDVAKSIIEVKTKINDRADLKEIFCRLGDNAERLRRDSNIECRIGLFVYDDTNLQNPDILQLLNDSAVSGAHIQRTINWVSIGSNQFFRYWEPGSMFARNESDGSQWRAYNLKELAPAYFISNVVWDISPKMPNANEPFWFPIEGGKEQHCTHAIRFRSNEGSIEIPH